MADFQVSLAEMVNLIGPDIQANTRGHAHVLIIDFDFYSALGGGQTFYRRLVERHPEWTFLYPSRGADLVARIRSEHPANVRPFAFDRFLAPWDLIAALQLDSVQERSFALLLAQIAVPLQGRFFDVVEVPSFFPIAHLVRPIFTAFGIGVKTISLGMLGWLSVSNRNAYSSEVPDEVVAQIEEIEQRCIAGADVSYTISDLHAAENLGTKPSAIVDMHDAFGHVPPPAAVPPGAGPPDLWFVGRLDRNKGPDLFIEMVARTPRSLYRGCFLCGPDNTWAQSGPRWSETVLELARKRNVPAEYLGEIESDELWSRVYRGRSVIVIPSRSDAFNYVAVEATTAGAPILLSNRAGAAQFLHEQHPEIAPLIIDPDHLDDAAAKLNTVLSNYDAQAKRIRGFLLQGSWPAPRCGFFADVIDSAAAGTGQVDRDRADRAVALSPLDLAPARIWRSVALSPPDLNAEIIIKDQGDRTLLGRTLASLRAPGCEGVSVTVLVAADEDAASRTHMVRDYHPRATCLLYAGAGSGYNRALDMSRAVFAMFLEAGDCVDGMGLSQLVRALQMTPEAKLALGRWTVLNKYGSVLRDERANLSKSALVAGSGETISGVLLRCAKSLFVDEVLGSYGLLDLYARLSSDAQVATVPKRIGWSWQDSAGTAPTQDYESLSRFLIKRLSSGLSPHGEAPSIMSRT